MVKFKVMNGKNDRKLGRSVCGHENIVHFLQSAISGDRVAHSYLFSGPSHLGKEKLARELIASLLCQNNSDGQPCGECSNCQQIKNGFHPDFYTVEREINEKTEKLRKDIVIDQIRDLRSKLQKATLLNGYKIALITDAHLMNNNAANGLLKILEEPTKNTVIILVAENQARLPQTIVSRCQVLKFLPVSIDEIKKCLDDRNVADSEVIARKSHGRPGLAISISQNPELSQKIDGNITGLLKILDSGFGQKFLIADDLIDWDKDEAVNVSNFNTLLSDWQATIRDMVLIKSNNENLVSHASHMPLLKKRADVSNFLKLESMLTRINLAGEYLRHNISAKSSLENLIINL